MADATKYSDAVSGDVALPNDGGACSASAWTAPMRTPSRLPNVIIRETFSLRRRFSIPPDRGLSSTLFGGSEALPCTDALIGRGVLDSGINDFGFDNDQFFGLDCPIDDEVSVAVVRPRSQSAASMPHRKRIRLRGKQAPPWL